MITAVPHPDEPLPRLDWRDPKTQRAIVWLDAHRDEERLGQVLGHVSERRDYATLVRFVAWAQQHQVLARRRCRPADVDTDDAAALKAAAKQWLRRQVQRNPELFDLLLRHAELQPVYVFVAWALCAGRLKDADEGGR